jgi:hypothetical protein
MSEMRAITLGGFRKRHHPDLKRSELIALNHYLHDFPRQLSYEAVLSLIDRDWEVKIADRRVIPFEIYEELWPFDLIIKIKTLQSILSLHYGD